MKGWIITGAVLAGIAILFGAFGAHILKNKITADYLTGFDTGGQIPLLPFFRINDHWDISLSFSV